MPDRHRELSCNVDKQEPLSESSRMTDKFEPILGRAPRFGVKDNTQLTVTIEKKDTSSAFIKAELVDLSVGGAKFKASEMIVVNQVLAVKIEAMDPERAIAVSGEVRWVTPAAGDDWTLGCSFDPPIPEQVLREFAKDGILECREHRREPISLRATAQWELQSETAAVWLLNYSRGGFCLLSQSDGRPGERTLLQLEREDGQVVVVPGKTQWQVESQEGFVIGYEFLDYRDYRVLSSLADSKPQDKRDSQAGWQLLGPQIPPTDADSEQPNRRSLLGHSYRMVAICAAVLLCFLIAGIQILTTPEKQRLESRKIASSTDSSDAATGLEQLAESHNNVIGEEPAQETAAPATSEAVPSPAILAEQTSRLTPNESVKSLDTDLSAHELPPVADEAVDDETNEGHARPMDGTTVESNAPRISPLVTVERAAEGQPIETTASDESWVVRILKPKSTVVETQRQASTTTEFGVLDSPPTDAETSAIDADLSDSDNDKSPAATIVDDTDEIDAPDDNANVSNLANPGENTGTADGLPLGYRRWQDNTGRYRVVARLVAVQGNIVRLQMKDGRRVSVPKDSLSQGDVRFIDRWLTGTK